MEKLKLKFASDEIEPNKYSHLSMCVTITIPKIITNPVLLAQIATRTPVLLAKTRKLISRDMIRRMIDHNLLQMN